MRHRHHRHKHEIGKKAVYMTEFRPAALEVKKMYELKGVKAEIEVEKSEYGGTIFVVYVFLGRV